MAIGMAAVAPNLLRMSTHFPPPFGRRRSVRPSSSIAYPTASRSAVRDGSSS